MSVMDEMPPELMGALQGEMAPPEMGPPMAEEMPEEEDDLSPAEHLRAAIDSAESAMVGEPDEADSAEMAEIVKRLYAILAKQQDDETKASGGDPKQTRTLRRAYGG